MIHLTSEESIRGEGEAIREISTLSTITAGSCTADNGMQYVSLGLAMTRCAVMLRRMKHTLLLLLICAVTFGALAPVEGFAAHWTKKRVSVYDYSGPEWSPFVQDAV